MYMYNICLVMKMNYESVQVPPERLPWGTAFKKDPPAKRLLGEDERNGGRIIITIGIIHL